MANIGSTGDVTVGKNGTYMVRQRQFYDTNDNVKDLVWWADGPHIYCVNENTDEVGVFGPREIAARLESERERIDKIGIHQRSLYRVTPERQHDWVNNMTFYVLQPAFAAFKEDMIRLGIWGKQSPPIEDKDKPKLILPE